MSAGLIETLSAETMHFPVEKEDQMSCMFVNLLFCGTLAPVAHAEPKSSQTLSYVFGMSSRKERGQAKVSASLSFKAFPFCGMVDFRQCKILQTNSCGKNKINAKWWQWSIRESGLYMVQNNCFQISIDFMLYKQGPVISKMPRMVSTSKSPKISCYLLYYIFLKKALP